MRVAIVTTFEVGRDTGDKPGEFQFWAEREKWTGSVHVAGVDHAVLTGPDGVIGVVAGTTSRAGNQLMALVLSGEFDFSRTYWLINGIAGVDPAAASIGSAAWARYVVDGDVGYELDPRDGRPGWPYGIMPIGSREPNQKPTRGGAVRPIMSYRLNSALVAWAFGQTIGVVLPDTDAMANYRAKYTDSPAAQRPPFVLLGTSLGSNRYWHGPVMTRWAEDWTQLWTDGDARFAMTDMEDQGFAAALTRLSTMHRVDFERVLFLRTASNYCTPPAKAEAAQTLRSIDAGYVPALEAAYRVGSVVVHEIAQNWNRFADHPPGE